MRFSDGVIPSPEQIERDGSLDVAVIFHNRFAGIDLPALIFTSNTVIVLGDGMLSLAA